MAGSEQRCAVLAPDLHVQVKPVGAEQFFGLTVQRLATRQHVALQGAGNLLQVVVKQGVGLLQRAAVGGGGLHQRSQQNSQQHKAEQAGFEGVGGRSCHGTNNF